jgi:hypothetical protein
MKSLLRLLAVAAVAFGFVSWSFAASAKVGMDAPDFTLTDIEGVTHTLSSFRGKTVVLEWVNPECPFVVKHYDRSGNIPGLQKTATADGVVWLLINSANSSKPNVQGDYSPEKVVAWMDKNSVAATAYMRDQSGDVGRLYGAKTTPHMFVINPAGVLVYDGAIDSIRSANAADIGKAENYVTAALAAVKAGTMPARTTTEPYGCTVKY